MTGKSIKNQDETVFATIHNMFKELFKEIITYACHIPDSIIYTNKYIDTINQLYIRITNNTIGTFDLQNIFEEYIKIFKDNGWVLPDTEVTLNWFNTPIFSC